MIIIFEINFLDQFFLKASLLNNLIENQINDFISYGKYLNKYINLNLLYFFLKK